MLNKLLSNLLHQDGSLVRRATTILENECLLTNLKSHKVHICIHMCQTGANMCQNIYVFVLYELKSELFAINNHQIQNTHIYSMSIGRLRKVYIASSNSCYHQTMQAESLRSISAFS